MVTSLYQSVKNHVSLYAFYLAQLIGPVDKVVPGASMWYDNHKEGWSMMGRQRGQMSMVILDIAELIPSDHLLRKIN